MNMEVGKTYVVNSSRKGIFSMKLVWQSDIWVGGRITEGTANALLTDNIKEVGEDIVVRKSLCSFKEQFKPKE